MRILHTIRTLNPAYGGPVEGLRNIVEAFDRRGHKIEVVTLDDPGASWLNGWPGKVHAIGSKRMLFAFSRQLDAWLRENIQQYNIVVSNGVWMYYSQAVRRAALRAGRPYYVFTHGMLDPWFNKAYPLKHIKKLIYWKLFEHKVLRDARATLFTTTTEMELAAKSFAPYKCNPQVVGYGILRPEGVASADRKKVSLEVTEEIPEIRSRPFFLFLARIHRKKGLDLLIQAFAATRNLFPEAALVIAGPGDEALISSLKGLAKSLGVDQSTIWTGPIYGQTKWKLLKSALAYCLPSHQENFGVSVAEALACGTPVLISDKVNICQDIVDSRAGIVGADDLSGTIKTLRTWAAMGSPQVETMRNNAVACFEQNYDLGQSCERLVSIFERDLSSLNRVGSSPAEGNQIHAT